MRIEQDSSPTKRRNKLSASKATTSDTNYAIEEEALNSLVSSKKSSPAKSTPIETEKNFDDVPAKVLNGNKYCVTGIYENITR